MDMNSAKDDSSSEVQARGKLAREKNAPQTEYNELKERVMVVLFAYYTYFPSHLPLEFSRCLFLCCSCGCMKFIPAL